MIKEKQGCNECKDFWQFSKASMPNAIFSNDERKTILYKCPNCSSYWEESQRFSSILSLDELRRYYPEIYKKIKERA